MLKEPLRSSHFAVALAATQIFALPGTPGVVEAPDGDVDHTVSLHVSIVESPDLTEVRLRAHREDLAEIAGLLLGAVQFIAGSVKGGELVLF